MRINLFGTLLFSLSGLAIAGLQANQHFFLPALAPSMYDIGTLFGVLVLAPEKGLALGPITLPAFGLGIYGVVYGTVIGRGAVPAGADPRADLLPLPLATGINLRHPGVRQVLALVGPRVLTVAAHPVYLLRPGQHRLAPGGGLGDRPG